MSHAVEEAPGREFGGRVLVSHGSHGMGPRPGAAVISHSLVFQWGASEEKRADAVVDGLARRLALLVQRATTEVRRVELLGWVESDILWGMFVGLDKALGVGIKVADLLHEFAELAFRLGGGDELAVCHKGIIDQFVVRHDTDSVQA